RTLILLLLTRMSSAQIVMGKFLSSWIGVANLVLSALPLLMLIALLGGVGVGQVLAATAIILVTTAWSGALANLIAFWREKTFQTLAITLLAIAGYLAVCEAIAAGAIAVVDPAWAELLSPLRALASVGLPIPTADWQGVPGGIAAAHSALGLLACAAF